MYTVGKSYVSYSYTNFTKLYKYTSKYLLISYIFRTFAPIINNHYPLRRQGGVSLEKHPRSSWLRG